MVAFRLAIVVACLSAGCLWAAEPERKEPSFSRHVVPLFSRLGCNAGSCHGAVKGQNGFRLSLFGADPAGDHDRLLHDGNGRRLSAVDPNSSLLLRKAAGLMPHEGGKLLSVDGADYRLLRDWILQGAKLDAVDGSRLVSLSIKPQSHSVKKGENYQLRIEATFHDKTTEDVTDLCLFHTTDRLVAGVDRTGKVTAVAPGDAAIVVRYRGSPAVAQIVVPSDKVRQTSDFPAVNFIDKHVAEKLGRLNIEPSALSDDATFLRRVCLDVAGRLPTPDEIRAFLDDKKADKRTLKIDELLASPEHAALWAMRFCDILRSANFDPKGGLVEATEARRFYEWVRARLTENLPYDQLVERILTATSREGREAEAWVKEVRTLCAENATKDAELKAYASRKTLDLYWQRADNTSVKHAVRVAHAFLGLRLECAQCHRHPHDVWTQDDLLSFANFFTRVSGIGAQATPEVVKVADAMALEVKQLKEDAKKLSEKAKDASLSKEDKAKLTADQKALADRTKALEDAGRRLKASEIHVSGKATPASVSSPLGTQKSDVYRLLGATQAVTVSADKDTRETVVAWLRQADNPFFARAIVNRVWAHYFGRGLNEPGDHLSPLNPASHPELLQELCDGFIKNKYDLRWLHRTIAVSRAYQLSAKTNASNKADKRNYASFYLRRLPAELLIDAINHATGGTETYPEDLRIPPGTKAVEVAGPTGSENRAASLHYPFQIFGRPLRMPDGQCDCERDSTPTIVQTLYLTNHPRLRDKITNPQGRLAKITKASDDPKKQIEEVYLWVVSRLPTESESTTCLEYLKNSPTPQRGLEDVMWSLLNTHEFLLQH